MDGGRRHSKRLQAGTEIVRACAVSGLRAAMRFQRLKLIFYANSGGELAHGGDAVGMRQLALHLAVLPLATGALQGDGGLRGEVPEKGNLFVGERLQLFAAESEGSPFLRALGMMTAPD
jgi:hypothetical protein